MSTIKSTQQKPGFLLQLRKFSAPSRLVAGAVAALAVLSVSAQGAEYRWNRTAGNNFSNAGNWQVFDGANWVAASSAPTGTDNIQTPNNFFDMDINDTPGNAVNNMTIDLGTDWTILNPSGSSTARTLTINGTLSKDGAATLTIAPDPTGPDFSLVVGGGVDALDGLTIFGTTTRPMTSVTVTGTTTVGDGATLRVNTGNATGSFGAIQMTNGSLYINASNVSGGTTGGITAASLSGTGTVRAKDTGTESSTATLTLNGTSGSELYDGDIRDGEGTGTTLTLLKSGASEQILTGSNFYSGGTVVSAGSLLINNPTGSGTGSGSVNVNSGLFGGTGSASGSVVVGDGSGSLASAVLAPGTDTTIGTLGTGSLSLDNSDASFDFEINSDALTSDLVNVAGALTLGSGVATLSGFDLGSTTLTGNEQFVLISTTGGITGNFAGLAEGANLVLGSSTFQISYGVDLANSLTLTAIPEPGTAGLLIGAIAGLALLRRCRTRRAS